MNEKNKDEVNELEMLMDILQRLTRIEQNTRNFDSTEKIANKAYSLAKQNERKLKSQTDNTKWALRTGITALIVPLLIFVIENMIGG